MYRRRRTKSQTVFENTSSSLGRAAIAYVRRASAFVNDTYIGKCKASVYPETTFAVPGFPGRDLFRAARRSIVNGIEGQFPGNFIEIQAAWELVQLASHFSAI